MKHIRFLMNNCFLTLSGFTFVKELTLDVENVVAFPKLKSSSVQKEATSAEGDLDASSSNAEVKSEKIQIPGKPILEKKLARDQRENGVARSPPDSPAGTRATESQSHEFQDSPLKESTGADDSLHAKELQRYGLTLVFYLVILLFDP